MVDLATGPCSDVCVLSYDGDAAEFYETTLPKARKTHQCIECGNAIQPGENYERTSAKWEDEVKTYKTCLLCVEIRNKFSCDGSWIFGTIWDELPAVAFNREVLPGDTIDLTITLPIPSQVGGYGGWYRLQNNKGFNFGDVFAVFIKVVAP